MAFLKPDLSVRDALELLNLREYLPTFYKYDLYEVDLVLRAEPAWLDKLPIDARVINLIRNAALGDQSTSAATSTTTMTSATIEEPRTSAFEADPFTPHVGNGYHLKDQGLGVDPMEDSRVRKIMKEQHERSREKHLEGENGRVAECPSSRNHRQTSFDATPRAYAPKSSYDDQPIYFYDLAQPYGEFSNFYPAPFYLDGRFWPTSEHYFQASKFHRFPEIVEEIHTLPRVRDVFDRAHLYHTKERKDWADVKEEMMRTALFAKFTTHPNLRQMLCDTGSKQLVEHTDKDSYWADGGDGSGQNRLGELLMEVRQALRNTKRYPLTSAEPPRLCPNCQKAPATTGHDCCSRECWNEYSQKTICQIPGCGKPAFPGSVYCSKKCRNRASESANASGNIDCYTPRNPPASQPQQSPADLFCTRCNLYPVYPGSAYCSRRCRDFLKRGGSNASNGTLVPSNRNQSYPEQITTPTTYQTGSERPDRKSPNSAGDIPNPSKPNMQASYDYEAQTSSGVPYSSPPQPTLGSEGPEKSLELWVKEAASPHAQLDTGKLMETNPSCQSPIAPPPSHQIATSMPMEVDHENLSVANTTGSAMPSGMTPAGHPGFGSTVTYYTQIVTVTSVAAPPPAGSITSPPVTQPASGGFTAPQPPDPWGFNMPPILVPTQYPHGHGWNGNMSTGFHPA